MLRNAIETAIEFLLQLHILNLEFLIRVETEAIFMP